MAKTVVIKLFLAGASTGPFSLFSDSDLYMSAFETDVTKESLLLGYTSILVPDDATIIRVQSTNACTNYVDIEIDILPTTTTTTTTTIL